jgi:hypothetical protein
VLAGDFFEIKPCMSKTTPSAYALKLKDPRWQRKRLEIFNRDGFACRFCGNKESTLHVHHLQYQWGKDPWDYESGHLLTLCADCHETETALRKESEQKLLELLRITVFATATDVDELANTIYMRASNTGLPFGTVVSAIEFALRDGEYINRYLAHREQVRGKKSSENGGGK